MPSGYTVGVQDGSVTNFRQFALQCARNFGALIEMREEALNVPIPDEFKPSDHHSTNLKLEENRLNLLQAMTEEDINASYEDWHGKQVKEAKESLDRQRREGERYSKMLKAVHAWEPPSEDHKNLKKFMIEQLTKSVKWDCDDDYYNKMTEREDPFVWHKENIESCQRTIEYHKKHWAEETQRCKERTEWVRLLKESLKTDNEQASNSNPKGRT